MKCPACERNYLPSFMGQYGFIPLSDNIWFSAATNAAVYHVKGVRGWAIYIGEELYSQGITETELKQSISAKFSLKG